MPRITKAQLEAQLEASQTEVVALRAHAASRTARIVELEDELARLQDREATLRSDAQLVESRAELLLRAKTLALRGVPCFVQGGFLYHRQTRAVLAQIRL